MDDQILLIYLYYLQAFLTLRYALKAVFGHVHNYSFVKLLMVAFIPVFGYLIVMKNHWKFHNTATFILFDFQVLNFLRFYLPATFRFHVILLIRHLTSHDNLLVNLNQ